MKYIRFICLCVFSFASTANANPVEVSYEIGPYDSGGFSASWLHTSTGCEGTGPDSGETLYMCGYIMSPISGTLEGTLEAGVLTISDGAFDMMGRTYDILGGNLGGDFTNASGDLLWFLDIEWFGRFYFENIAMGAGRPNHFGSDSFVLWGQNSDAYGCSVGAATTGRTACSPWGIDLYGELVSVTEPGSLMLLALGLAGIAAARRRRTISKA